MIRQILVPLDGSARAEAILPAVEVIGRLTGAGITVLQAIEPLHALLDRSGADEARRAAERRAPHYLADVAGRLGQAGLTAQSRVVFGPAATEILRAARAVDLIALASHGRGGWGHGVAGTVAARVVRHAPVPVLLLRVHQAEAHAAGRPRRILVPLDGSTLAEQALPLAGTLAERAGADLIVAHSLHWLHTAIGVHPGDGAGLGAVCLLAQAEAAARAYLDEVRQRLAGQGLTVHTDLRHLPAATAIMAGAAAHGADLVVMSTPGRRWGRWGGAVDERVLRGLAVPLLLVPTGVPAAAEALVAAAVPAPATG